MSIPAIVRVDGVTIDYPSPTLREPLGNIFVWKAAYGFECVVSIARRLYHGVSPDGKWLVMERYPGIPAKNRSRQWHSSLHEKVDAARRRGTLYARIMNTAKSRTH